MKFIKPYIVNPTGLEKLQLLLQSHMFIICNLQLLLQCQVWSNPLVWRNCQSLSTIERLNNFRSTSSSTRGVDGGMREWYIEGRDSISYNSRRKNVLAMRLVIVVDVHRFF